MSVNPTPTSPDVESPAEPRGTRRRPNGRSAAAERSALRRDLMEGELFEHAARLFAEKGFAGTTLQDIATAMGVSRPSLYYYIQSKDELLERLVEEFTLTGATILGATADDQTLTPDEKLRRVVRSMAELVASQPSRFQLLAQSETSMPDKLAKVQTRLRRQVLKRVIAIIDEGKKAGMFRPVDSRIAALALIGECNWMAWWFHPGRDNVDTVAEQLADTAVHGLVVEPHNQATTTAPDALLGIVRENLDRLEAAISRGRNEGDAHE